MAKMRKPIFIRLEAIPADECDYLPSLGGYSTELVIKVTRDFLQTLSAGQTTTFHLEMHQEELDGVGISRREAAALAIAAYEQASALGLTDAQRGAWFFNLMLVGCDPKYFREATGAAYALRSLGFGKKPEILAQIVAEHFSVRYLNPA